MGKKRVGDIDLYYEMEGVGETVLLIHGLGSSSRDWEPQRSYFAANYQVISMDIRGHGRSHKPPGPYTVAQFAADTAALLSALEITAAHVVGISMGGMIAFQLAVTYPELVKSLVIVNSGPELVVRSFKERLQVWQRFLIVQLLGMQKMGEVLSERLLPRPEHAPIRAEFVARWAENDPRAYRAAMRALIGWSVSDRLRDITCPTLFIASDSDYTPVATKEKCAKMMPQAELVVIEDARHAVTIERPQQFNAVLADFLQKQHRPS